MQIIKKLAKDSKVIEFFLVMLIVFSFDLIFIFRYGFNLTFIHFIFAFFNVALIFSVMSFIKNNRLRYIVYVTYIMIMFIFFLTDSTLYHYKQDVTSIAMLLESLRDTMEIGLKYSPLDAYGILLWVLIVSFMVIGLIVLNKIVKYNKQSKSSYLVKRLSFLLVAILGLLASPFIINANDSLTYKTPSDKSLFVQKFGSITYHAKDVVKFVSNSVKPRLLREEYESELDANFDSTIADQSGLFGELEGQNIIMIQCETCEQYGFSRTYTPNYYRLYDDGVYFENFYSAAKNNYTYDAEMKALTSMMYFQNDNFMYSFDENQYNNALPYILNQEGYTTNAFHNYHGVFFNRNVVYPKMGFENFYAADSLQSDSDAYLPLDSTMFDQMRDLMVPVQDDPFFTFVVTVTPHGPHNKYRDELKKHYDTLAQDPLYANESIELLTFIAGHMDFDEGLGILFDELEEKNLLDTTTIILYSDHKNYSDYKMTVEYTPNSDIPFEIEKVPFIIYNQTFDSGVNDVITSQYDITPTILDFLGISYIQYYYYGQSMFLDNRIDLPVILSYTSWISYENVVQFDVIKSGNDDEERYLEQKQFVYDMISKYEKIFQSDYFRDKTTYITNQ